MDELRSSGFQINVFFMSQIVKLESPNNTEWLIFLIIFPLPKEQHVIHMCHLQHVLNANSPYKLLRRENLRFSCFIKPQVVHLCINHSLAHFLYVRALNIFFCYRIISKILQMCTREYLEDKFPEVELLGQEIKS